jgi:hypothetical protein
MDAILQLPPNVPPHASPLVKPVTRRSYLGSEEKMSMKTTKVIYNALDPDHLNGVMPIRSAFHYAYPKSIQDRVLSNWQQYGYHEVDVATRNSFIQEIVS